MLLVPRARNTSEPYSFDSYVGAASWESRKLNRWKLVNLLFSGTLQLTTDDVESRNEPTYMFGKAKIFICMQWQYLKCVLSRFPIGFISNDYRVSFWRNAWVRIRRSSRKPMSSTHQSPKTKQGRCFPNFPYIVFVERGATCDKREIHRTYLSQLTTDSLAVIIAIALILHILGKWKHTGALIWDHELVIRRRSPADRTWFCRPPDTSRWWWPCFPGR